ncbi:MAG: hypothetical protein HKP40_02310, partial [Litoreibacter sp.]|nr:hypothetical protein [Litoreibacter sp.]
MGKGIFAGLLWGLIVCFGAAFVLSIVAPMTPASDPGEIAETPAPASEATVPSIVEPVLPEVAEVAPEETPAPAPAPVEETVQTVQEETSPAPKAEPPVVAEAPTEPAPEPGPEPSAELEVAQEDVAQTETSPQPVETVPEVAPELPGQAILQEQSATAETAGVATPEPDGTAVSKAASQAPAAAAPEPETATDLAELANDIKPEPAPTPELDVVAALEEPAMGPAAASVVTPEPAPSAALPQKASRTAEAAEADTVPTQPADPEAPAEPTQIARASPASEPIAVPLPQITDPVQEGGAAIRETAPQSTSRVIVNRLPSVRTPEPATEETVAEVEEDAAPLPTAVAGAGALQSFSAGFEAVPGQPLFSVILIDTGENGLTREQLSDLALPVTIAIDPARPDAREVMAFYRAAGVEVVALLEDLPTSAGPGDVSVALAGYFEAMPEVIAVMDPLDGRLRKNRSLFEPLLQAVARTGHGFITYD